MGRLNILGCKLKQNRNPCEGKAGGEAASPSVLHPSTWRTSSCPPRTPRTKPGGLRTQTRCELKWEAALGSVVVHTVRGKNGLQPPLHSIAYSLKKVASYLVFLNLCPEGVELLQSQFTTPVILCWVKGISLEGRKRGFPPCAGFTYMGSCDLKQIAIKKRMESLLWTTHPVEYTLVAQDVFLNQ